MREQRRTSHMTDPFEDFFQKGDMPQLLIEPETGRVISVNAAAEHFYGWEVADLIGRNIHTLSLQENKNTSSDESAKHIREHMNCKQVCRDGTVRSVQLHMTPITMGERAYLHTLVIDETRKTSTLKQYLHELKKMEVLLSAMDDGFFLLEADERVIPTKFVEVGSAVAHRMGYKREDLIGRPVADFLPVLNNRDMQAVIEALRAHGKVHKVIRSRLSNAREAQVEVKAHLLRHNDTNYILAITRERSQSHEVRKERDNQSRRFCSLFQNVPDAMFLLDRELMVVDMNPSAENMFALRRQDTLGTDLRNWIMKEPQRQEAQSVVETVQRGRAYTKPVKRYDRLGREVHAMLTAYETTMPDGAWGMLVSYSNTASSESNQLLRLVYQDSLTGLENRDALMNQISKAIAENTPGEGFQLMYFDIHQFKEINDTLGNLFGDAVLRKVASHLKDTLPPEAVLARVGGDHFACLVRLQSDGLIKQLIQAVMRRFEKPLTILDKEVEVLMHIGVAAYPQHGENEEILLSNAELALSQAKKSQSPSSCLFTQHMRQHFIGDLQVRQGLRTALDNEEIHLYYQPIVRMDNKKLAGFEALMRWKSPSFGMVSPSRFIPFAEQGGMIHQLGKWALSRAAYDLQALRRKVEKDVFMSVNVSPVQLQHFDFMREICTVLEAFPQNGGLDIELTESAYMQDYFQLNRTMQALKSMGIRVAIDDFGTGYSSLGQITTLNIDKVKIDKSFIQGIGKNERSAVVIRAVMSMFKELDKPLIAEGIETADQYEWLLKRGCHYGQGYLFGKPQPLAYWMEKERLDTLPIE